MCGLGSGCVNRIFCKTLQDRIGSETKSHAEYEIAIRRGTRVLGVCSADFVEIGSAAAYPVVDEIVCCGRAGEGIWAILVGCLFNSIISSAAGDRPI